MPGVNFSPVAAQLLTAAINSSATGNITLVTGVAKQIIRCYRIFLVVSGTTNLTFQDGASTALTGAMAFVANGSLALDFSAEPWFTTSAGNAFVLKSDGGVQVSGAVYYQTFQM